MKRPAIARIYGINRIILLSLSSSLMVSCKYGKDETCEAFDFNVIPFDTTYYSQRLTYSNGIDTLILLPNGMDFSKATTLSPFTGECDISFSVSNHSKQDSPEMIKNGAGWISDLNYSFSYNTNGQKPYPIDFRMRLMSSTIKLPLDSIWYGSDGSKEKIFENFFQLNESNPNRNIRKIKMREMRVIMFETFAGTTWKLIPVGDTFSNNEAISQRN